MATRNILGTFTLLIVQNRPTGSKKRVYLPLPPREKPGVNKCIGFVLRWYFIPHKFITEHILSWDSRLFKCQVIFTSPEMCIVKSDPLMAFPGRGLETDYCRSSLTRPIVCRNGGAIFDRHTHKCRNFVRSCHRAFLSCWRLLPCHPMSLPTFAIASR